MSNKVLAAAGGRAMIEIPDSDGLRKHLDNLNELGLTYLVSGMDADGDPFLAFLRGPYAKTVGVLIHNPWDGESEIDNAEDVCDDCRAQGAIGMDDLTYPVVVISR